MKYCAIRIVSGLAAIMLVAAAYAQHPFERLATLSGNYAGLPDQTAQFGPEFGYSVAISGDWLAVGAPSTIIDSGGARMGAVFLFRNQGDEWELVQRIVPDTTNFVDGSAPRCGHSVALSGSSLVIGCPTAKLTGGPNPDPFVTDGVAMIYQRDSANNWQHQGRFWGDSGEECGRDVSISSNAIFIGAPVLAVSGCRRTSGKGSVRVYTYDGDAWSFDAVIESSDGAIGDNFGAAVALHRSCTLIPFPICLTRLAVGAPSKHHGNAILAGSVYVFSGSNWSETDIFTHPTPDSFEATFFGASVDINATQLVIGSPGALTLIDPQCENHPRCGIAFHRELDGGNWAFVGAGGAINSGGAPPGEQEGMRFGDAVALGFDNWIAVAAPFTDGPDGSGGVTEDAGMVELRRKDNGDWGASWNDNQGEVRPAAGSRFNQSDSHFGTSVAFGDDRWLAVGWPRAKLGAFPAPSVRRGLVYMYAEPDGIFADRFEE